MLKPSPSASRRSSTTTRAMAPTSPTKASSARTIGFLTVVGALAVYVAILLLADRRPSLDFFAPCRPSTQPTTPAASAALTDETHLAFAILGSKRSISRRPFVEMWWRPNRTRGLIWLEPSQAEEPWPSTSPPYRVFHRGVPVPLQMKRVIEETFGSVGGPHSPPAPRWLVLGDDDTVFFVDNLVDVLRKYDHEGFYYVGGDRSESSIQNSWYHGMAFGGGGVALSLRLVRALLPILEGCLARYRSLIILDQIFYSCISEIGVPLTRELGFHQVDLRGNVSGYLSAHPQVPLVTLHHVELVEPIFPSATKVEAMGRLMGAARADASRVLQQSFCYEKGMNWTFSVSFGYSVHVHEFAVEPRTLQLPLQTFRPWRKSMPPFSFETRHWRRDPCRAPHEFYLEAVEANDEAGVVTRYVRHSPRDLPNCGNYSVNGLEKISVITPEQKRRWVGGRRECCEVHDVSRGGDHALVTVRPCMEGETI